jgi:SHS2 domain-containing protein
MASTRWEHFAHEADMGIRGIGASKEEAFEQAALALTAVIVDPQELTAEEVVEVTCEAPDDELLLVDWLNALVYQMATRRLFFCRFEVHIDGHRLHAQAWGEPIEVARHRGSVSRGPRPWRAMTSGSEPGRSSRPIPYGGSRASAHGRPAPAAVRPRHSFLFTTGSRLTVSRVMRPLRTLERRSFTSGQPPPAGRRGWLRRTLTRVFGRRSKEAGAVF